MDSSDIFYHHYYRYKNIKFKFNKIFIFGIKRYDVFCLVDKNWKQIILKTNCREGNNKPYFSSLLKDERYFWIIKKMK